MLSRINFKCLISTLPAGILNLSIPVLWLRSEYVPKPPDIDLYSGIVSSPL